MHFQDFCLTLTRVIFAEIYLSILEPLVKQCIPLPMKLYKRTRRRLRTIDEVEEYFPGFKAFIDSTEQEISRPKNKRRRKSYYSGKKKKHTVKTQYMVNSEGFILHKTDHKKGRKHDYDVYKNKCRGCKVLYYHLEREEKVNSLMKKGNTIESTPN
jgi:hypothetical protein